MEYDKVVFMTNKKYNTVSLFSGCGGLDLGFIGGFNVFGREYKKNPFKVILANDFFPQACATYRNYFGDHIFEGDITQIKKDEIIPKDAEVVLGGFPCQDFSVAGKRQGITVKRGRLYLELLDVIKMIKPKVFVAENVEGLVNMAGGEILEAIKNDLRQHDENGRPTYQVTHHLLHAADYGVPQIRKRVFIVGVRSDLKVEYIPPQPTHSNNWMTAKEAIDDLWGKEDDLTIFNHSQISRAKFYPGRRMQGNSQIRIDQPSVTIRAEHHGNIEAHYRSTNPNDPLDMTYWRRLSVRECARIQSFPDNFEFLGAGTYTYKMIGNAVPPVLGWHVAHSVADVLRRAENQTRSIKDGSKQTV
jgi:DNA (cytosine-5)-methyltransferase 1